MPPSGALFDRILIQGKGEVRLRDAITLASIVGQLVRSITCSFATQRIYGWLARLLRGLRILLSVITTRA